MYYLMKTTKKDSKSGTLTIRWARSSLLVPLPNVMQARLLLWLCSVPIFMIPAWYFLLSRREDILAWFASVTKKQPHRKLPDKGANPKERKKKRKKLLSLISLVSMAPAFVQKGAMNDLALMGLKEMPMTKGEVISYRRTAI